MADDITARIILSVEYEDAVQKCADVENALERITEAREKEKDAAQETTKTATENAKSMEKEAAAAEKTAEAAQNKAQADMRAARASKKKAEADKISYEEAKRMAAEQIGMSVEEWDERGKRNLEMTAQAIIDANRRANEALQAEEAKAMTKAESASPERSAAIEELRERKRIMKEVRAEESRISQMTKEDLAEEIRDQRLLVAEEQRKLAIEKEILLQRKLNDVRDQLEDPNVRQDPEKFNEALKLRDQYEQESSRNTKKILESEQQVRKLSVDQAALAAEKEAQAEAKKVAAAEKAAAKEMAAAEKAAAKKIREAEKAAAKEIREAERVARATAKQKEKEVREAEKAAAKKVRAAERAAEKAAKAEEKAQKRIENARKKGNVLQAAARGVGRLIGREIPTEGLSGAGGTFIAGGLAGGAVLNLAKQSWSLYQDERKADTDQRINRIDDMKANVESYNAEMEARLQSIKTLEDLQQAEKLSNVQKLEQENIIKKLNNHLGRMSVEVDTSTGKINNMGSVAEHLFEQNKENQKTNLQQLLNQAMAERATHEKFLSEATAFTQIYDMRGIEEAAAAEQRLSNTIIDLQKKIGELNKTLTEEEKLNRTQKRNAQLTDDIERLREQQKSRRYNSMDRSQSWRIREADLEKYSLDKIKALRENTSEKKWKEIESLKGSNILSDAKAYNEQAQKYKNDLQELTRLEQKRAEYENFNINVQRQLSDMREQLKYQKMINQGKGREVAIQQLLSEVRKKNEREGWSPKDAAAYGKLRAAELARESRINLGSIGREAWKYKSTSTGAVMANSLEGMRLQTRMLMQNTPDVKLLKESQTQSNLLAEINRRLKNWQNTVTIKSQSV